MKKITKFLATTSAVLTMSLSMAIAASAATSADVVSAAKANGAPSQYCVELQNYLNANGSSFTSADYDSMISSMSSTYNTYLKSAVESMYGAGTDPSSLTDAELIAAIKTLSADQQNAILASAKSTAAQFGIELSFSAADNGGFDIFVSKKSDDSGKGSTGNVVVGANTSNTAKNTGVGSFGAVEAAALATLVLASVGTFALSKKNTKSVM